MSWLAPSLSTAKQLLPEEFRHFCPDLFHAETASKADAANPDLMHVKELLNKKGEPKEKAALHLEMAEILLHDYQFRRARRELIKARQLSPSPWADVLKALCDVELKLYTSAARLLKLERSILPDFFWVLKKLERRETLSSNDLIAYRDGLVWHLAYYQLSQAIAVRNGNRVSFTVVDQVSFDAIDEYLVALTNWVYEGQGDPFVVDQADELRSRLEQLSEKIIAR